MSADHRSRIEARKELLLARASIERLELAGHISQLKASLAPAALVRSVWPNLGTAGGASAALKVWQTLRRYPILSSAASMVFARIPFRGVFRLLKLGGSAFAAYQGYKLWQQTKPDDEARERRAARKAAREQARALRDIAKRS